MRTICTVFFFFLLVGLNCQVTKINSKTGNFNTVNTFPTLGDEGVSEPINVEFFYQIQENYDTGKMNIIFYNLDLTEYKTVVISIPNGYVNFGLMYVTTKLFNDDEKIEFIYEFSDVTYTNTLYKLTNEDGENLFDFVNEVPSNTYTAKTGDFIFTTSSKINNVWYTNFYSTQKKSTQTESLSLINRVVQPFPNPADQIIYLPYHIDSGEHTDMKIFDVNGKLIDEKKIDKASDKVVLNISDYKTGTYIYRYNNKSEKFIVR